MSSFIVIPYIKVQAANFQSSGLMMGGAPLIAAAMLSHNLARQLKTQDDGFYFIHHDMQRLGGEAYMGINYFYLRSLCLCKSF